MTMAIEGGHRRLDDLPGPRPWPLLGNALQVRRERFHLQLEEWARLHGAPFLFRLGSRRFMVVTAPDVIGDVLRRRPDAFRRTQRFEQIARETGFLGLFAANGDTWRRQRPMVLASLDPAHIRNFFPALVEVTERLRRRWETAARAGTLIDVQSDLMRYTVDVTTGLAFGENINTLEQSDGQAIQRHLNVVMPHLIKRLLAPFDLPRWLRASGERELQGHIAALHEAVADFVARTRRLLAQRPELREHPENLIQTLVAARDREGSQVTDEDVTGNVLTMLLAGEDTTANTLAWLMWLLCRNPQACAAARAEVDAVLAGSPGVQDAGQLARLDLLEACASEAMRLKPVAPFIINEAIADTTVGDVRVPRGAMVLCLMRPAGLDGGVFAEPQRFEPARWLDAAAGAHAMASPKRHTMPFGAGPRMCPGRYLAMAEIKMVAAMLLANFELAEAVVEGGEEPGERITIVMSPGGLRMRLRPRPQRAAAPLSAAAVQPPPPRPAAGA